MNSKTKPFKSKPKLRKYRGDAWRVVESQEAVATSEIVDSFAEQDLLEAMLEAAKPLYRKGTEDLHYLIKTAFRYPPLKHGSRFGTQLMPSYFYASEVFETALCETAYYRFLFLEHMQSPYDAPIRSEYSLFKVTVASKNCLDTTTAALNNVKSQLVDPQSYQYSQSVGQWAAEQEPAIEIIRFFSARQSNAVNLAVAEPKAIRSRQPRELRQWLCLTRWNSEQPGESSVSFRSRDSADIYEYQRSHFCNAKGRFLAVK